MRVLIATDGSTFSRDAIAQSLRFLDLTNMKFRVVSCWEEPEEVAMTTYDMAIEYYKQADLFARNRAESDVAKAETQIRRTCPDERVKIETKVLSGPPDKTIVEEARRWRADMIVVGTHGRGFWGRLLGSISTGIIHHAPCTVFVGRTKEKPNENGKH